MKKIFFSLFVAMFFMAVGNVSNAQVDVTPSLATYANLKAAFAAVNAGTHGTGAVTVTVTSSYAEPDSAVLTGASYTSCLITTSGANTVTGNANSPIIILEDADNVTIDGRIGQTGTTRSLTITNTNAGANNAIVCWRNGASNNTVRYINAVGISTVGRLLQIAQTAAGGSGGCNNNVIEYNSINKGVRGIQVFGTANAGNSFTNDNTVIRGNIVKNASTLAIFIGSYVKNVTCTQNELFFDEAATMAASWVGIQVQAVGTIDITKNVVRDLSSAVGLSSAVRGSIALPVSVTPLPDPVTTVNYVNNMFSLYPNNPTGSLVIALQTQFSAAVQFINYTANVYNNTCKIGGASSTATAALTETYAGNVVTPIGTQTFNMNLKNNIFINERTGGSATAFHIACDYDSSGNVTRNNDNNLFWCAGGTAGTSWATAHGSFVYPNGALEAYKANMCYIPAEQHSIFKNVNFVSTSNLRIGGPVGGDLNGTPLAAVTDDIDGGARAATYPWKGCDEGAAFKLLTLGAQLEGVVATPSDVMVSLRNGACGIVSTARADVNGTGVFCFGDSVANGTGYYLDVTTLNHLQTVSAATQSFTAGALSYDFRTAQTQSFGGNAVLEGANWAFFGGDVTQDGTVDASDGALIDTDAFNFIFGCYLATDINGDGAVDATDANITDNNAFNFVGVATPCPGPTAPTVEPSQKVFNNNRPNVEMSISE